MSLSNVGFSITPTKERPIRRRPSSSQNRNLNGRPVLGSNRCGVNGRLWVFWMHQLAERMAAFPDSSLESGQASIGHFPSLSDSIAKPGSSRLFMPYWSAVGTTNIATLPPHHVHAVMSAVVRSGRWGVRAWTGEQGASGRERTAAPDPMRRYGATSASTHRGGREAALAQFTNYRRFC